MTGPVKVILDSNAFFVPFQLKIDIFNELRTILNANYEAVLLSVVKRELERLAKDKSPKMQKMASEALKLAGKCRMVDVSADDLSTDEVIMRVADEWRCPVFSNDALLRRKLRDINVPVIYVRQKSRLEVDGRL